MAYRLFVIKIRNIYDISPSFWRQHENLSFNEIVERCRMSGFMYPASMKPELENLGVEVMETLIDCPEVQNKWRRENGLPVSGFFDKDATLLAQIKKFKPDIVYFQTFFALAPEVRKSIRNECPSVRLIVGHRGFPIDDAAGYEDVDALFLGYLKYHEVWHKVGVKTFMSLHGFDDPLLPAIEQRAKEIGPIEFSFIGHTGWGSGPHDGRYFDLRKVMDTLPLTVYGHEPNLYSPALEGLSPRAHCLLRKAFIEIFKYSPLIGLKVISKAAQIAHVPVLRRAVDATWRRKNFGPESPPAPMEDFWWHHVPPIKKLYPDRCFPSRFGVDYHALLAASELTWNRHQDTPGSGANMRLFEACGVGTCQIVDAREEVLPCYEPDSEIVTYSSIDECQEKARWLLDHPDERRKIAEAGKRRTFKDHLTRYRMREMHEHLVELLHTGSHK